MGKNTPLKCLSRIIFAGLSILLSMGGLTNAATVSQSDPNPTVTQTMKLVTAFKPAPALSNDEEHFEIPAKALAELERELRNWWFRKNQPQNESPANVYRRGLIQEAMQIIYRDHKEHILRIRDEAAYYGPTYTTLSRKALGADTSALVKSLADNGQIGILTEVEFQKKAETPTRETQFVPLMWSFTIVIRVGQESFIDLVHISQ